jgi:3'-phosphoadenosine 5'-phosphosulfate synthase
MKGSMEAVAHKDDDLYDGDHGRYVLQMSPGIGDMKMLSFVKVMYDVKTNAMTVPDESRLEDFISISGTKMRGLARAQATPCPDHVPTDLVEANCVPNGFMVPKGWDIVTDYYHNIDAKAEEWIPWSRPKVTPRTASHTVSTGAFGQTSFALSMKAGESWWHDIDTWYDEDENLINFVTEIPMYMTAKMEVNKEAAGNAIKQDLNKDGSPRYYTYGTPTFNYGMIPQTWEDPEELDEDGHGGDNDPLDVMEVGGKVLKMGSTTACKVLGSLELIDDGETDHKILCVAKGSENYKHINDVASLEKYYPGTIDNLVHWLKYYKTSDGKGVNVIANNEVPLDVDDAVDIINDTRGFWQRLCKEADNYDDEFDLERCPP